LLLGGTLILSLYRVDKVIGDEASTHYGGTTQQLLRASKLQDDEQA
jgi:hypothetical protein